MRALEARKRAIDLAVFRVNGNGPVLISVARIFSEHIAKYGEATLKAAFMHLDVRGGEITSKQFALMKRLAEWLK
jgi:hypothetical protein